MGIRKSTKALVWTICLLANAPTSAQVVLNEVMFDPLGNEATDEFVELVNVGSDTVDLHGWKLGDQDEQDALIDAGHGLRAAPGQFILVLDPNYFEGSRVYDSVIPPSALVVTIDDASFGRSGFSNTSPETVLLISANGDTVSRYRYSLDNAPGHSDEKIDPTAGDGPENWANSLRVGGSPGAWNSVARTKSPWTVHLPGALSLVAVPEQEVLVELVVEGPYRETDTYIRLALFWDRDDDRHLDSAEVVQETSLLLPASSRSERVSLAFCPCCPGLFLLRGAMLSPVETVSDDSLCVRVAARVGDVRINEIYYRPESGQPEWVELANVSDRPVNLAGWRVKDATPGAGAEVPNAASSWLLAPGGLAVIAADTSGCGLGRLWPGRVFVPTGGFPSLNNNGDSVVVIDPVGKRIDAVGYLPSWGGGVGVSLERIRATGPSNERSNWASCRAPSGATPGMRNSVAPPDSDLSVAEVRAMAGCVEERARVEVRVANHGTAEMQGAVLGLRLWEGLPCIGSERYLSVPLPGTLAPGETSAVIESWLPAAPGWTKLEARLLQKDQFEANDFRSGFVYVSPCPGALRINEIQYEPPQDEAEWVEVVNVSAAPLSLDGWFLGDSRQRVRLDSIGQCIAPGGFGLIAASRMSSLLQPDVPLWVPRETWPALNNTGDAVVIVSPSGAVLDSVYYRPSWRRGGRGSLERLSTTADSQDSSNWAASIDPCGCTPGRENSVALRQVDLAVVSCEPVRAYWPESRKLLVEVRNVGLSPVAGGRIWARLGGGPFASAEVPGLGVGQSARLTLELDAPSPGGWPFEVLIQCLGDGRAENDTLRGQAYLSPPRNAVVVNEIYAQTTAGQHEWVELANTSAWDLDLQGWKLCDSRGRRYAASVREPCVLRAGGLCLLAEAPEVTAEWPDLPESAVAFPTPWPSLNDTGDELVLLDPNGLVQDSLAYRAEWGLARGFSLERVSKRAGSNEGGNWLRCTLPEGATPGRENSVSRTHPASANWLTVAPVPFSPDGDGRDDWLFVAIDLPVPTATVRLEVFDLLGRRVRTLADDQPCGPQRLFLWDGRTDAGMLCRTGAYIVSLRWWTGDGRSGTAVCTVALARP
ncbi:MAG: lamin tail domain-containing protein [candidate division KSB1 bacterium]|nr:lamin tail domain-containing protein [candidate division KSB1 bacterium]